MSGLLPVAVYGLEVPPGDVMIPAAVEGPATFRISMAAIDPTAEPEYDGGIEHGSTPRATLKLIRQQLEHDDDSEYDSDADSDSEADRLDAILNGADSEEEDSEEDEANGGPSDLSKAKKARQEAKESLKQALAAGGMDSLDKGKGKATDLDDISGSDEDDDDLEFEEYVICTLDPNTHYQQTLDITVSDDERVFFKVTGTHAIFLTGNYVIPGDGNLPWDREEDEEYDLSPDEDEILDDEDMLDDEDEESDELDDIADPRITELDEDEVPKLVAKGKNKRAAQSDSEEEGATLDGIISKALKPETNGEKLSKKQQKKLKNNAGAAVTASTKVETDSPAGKKVSFAKNLEQGPTGSQITTEKKVNGTTVEKSTAKVDASKTDAKQKPGATGVSTVKGVKIDVRKSGSGPGAKKGSKVSMRYIGKLKDGKQFDANKKGKPFTFKLGAGEVIQGWEIGMEGITAGGERRITIPAHLAYGKKALPGIPANSELTFDVKCLEVS